MFPDSRKCIGLLVKPRDLGRKRIDFQERPESLAGKFIDFPAKHVESGQQFMESEDFGLMFMDFLINARIWGQKFVNFSSSACGDSGQKFMDLGSPSSA